MAIRRRKDRAKQYQVYWNNPFTGKRESVSFDTLAEARKEDSLVQHRLKHERESFRPEEEDLRRTGGTVAEIIPMYLASKKFTPDNLQTTLEHLRPVGAAFDRREVLSLEKKDFIKFISDAAAKGIKITTSHRRLGILRSAIAWAAENGIIDHNPIQDMKLPQGQYEVFVPPSPAEASAILSVIQKHVYRAVALSIFLGVRVGPSELFKLRWNDVDLGRGVIRVWSANKNAKRPYRDVPIRPSLLVEMKGWREEDREKGHDNFIITYRGQPIKSMKSGWRAALRRAGITRRIRPYDLRHAFATLALDAGADIKAISDVMGHADPTMILKHYQHTTEALRRSAVEAVPDLIPETTRPSQDCTSGKASEGSAPQ
ncbi:MAG: tyrosine-type recombinase/integrase [Deltaproteobacteria bacterium]|jgi:integrase|nr:tyrosine-type recombinase/integrase [Deltaproteobacteria bacterium]